MSDTSETKEARFSRRHPFITAILAQIIACIIINLAASFSPSHFLNDISTFFNINTITSSALPKESSMQAEKSTITQHNDYLNIYPVPESTIKTLGIYFAFTLITAFVFSLISLLIGHLTHCRFPKIFIVGASFLTATITVTILFVIIQPQF